MKKCLEAEVMIEGFLYTGIVISSFLLMEGVAWASHKFLMHGPLWFLHRDHHLPDNKSFFQRNDFFFALFALPGIALIYIGTNYQFVHLIYVGLGIAVYGLAYFLVHDVFIHQRFRISGKTKNSYLKALRKAHRIHHKKVEKEGGECFGMLLVPWKFIRETRKTPEG